MERARPGESRSGRAATRTTRTSPTRRTGWCASSRSRQAQRRPGRGSSCRTSASTAPRRAASTPAPPGAIYRTEFGTVNINQDVCNGCRYCVVSCPFGVVSFNHRPARANKCTFCNDRIHNGLGPACAKTCPTESIQFGFRDDLVAKARQARRGAQGDGLQGRPALRRRHQRSPRRAQRLLPAAGQAVHLQPSGQAAAAAAQRLVDSLLSVGSALLVGLAACSWPSASGAARGVGRCLSSPDWELMIVWYFFLGGIAGGAYFTAAIADNFGSARDRSVCARRLPALAAARRRLRHAADRRTSACRRRFLNMMHDASSSGTRCRIGAWTVGVFGDVHVRLLGAVPLVRGVDGEPAGARSA